MVIIIIVIIIINIIIFIIIIDEYAYLFIIVYPKQREKKMVCTKVCRRYSFWMMLPQNITVINKLSNMNGFDMSSAHPYNLLVSRKTYTEVACNVGQAV